LSISPGFSLPNSPYLTSFMVLSLGFSILLSWNRAWRISTAARAG